MGQVHWSWEAELKEGELENFKSLIKQWNIIASEDSATLSNEWFISDDGRLVRVLQTFSDANSALNQFGVNLWSALDNHVTPKEMYVSGDYGDTLDFLREHGATFMVQLN